MKIETKLNIDLDNNIDLGNHQVLFTDLTSEEFDKIQGLFKSILNYGQFSNHKDLSNQLSLSEIMHKVFAKKAVVDETISK